MKHHRRRNPTAKFTLQYDKLFVDKEIYVYNELSGRVEPLAANDLTEGPNGTGNGSSAAPGSAHERLVRKKSS